MTEQEMKIIKDLMENQTKILQHVKDLQTENAEIKAQLAGKQKPEIIEPTEAEINTVFAQLRV